MDEEVVVGVEGEEEEGVVINVEERIVGIAEVVGEANVNEIVLIDKVMLMFRGGWPLLSAQPVSTSTTTALRGIGKEK